MLSGESDNISVEVRDIVNDFSNILYASSLSLIELVFLFENKKIKTRYSSAEALLRNLSQDFYVEILHTKNEHFDIYSKLKIAENHKDQIDHFIISQAISEKMVLVSSDRKFKEYRPQNLNFVFNKR